jgi:hypothetical protein
VKAADREIDQARPVWPGATLGSGDAIGKLAVFIKTGSITGLKTVRQSPMKGKLVRHRIPTYLSFVEIGNRGSGFGLKSLDQHQGVIRSPADAWPRHSVM